MEEIQNVLSNSQDQSSELAQQKEEMDRMLSSADAAKVEFHKQWKLAMIQQETKGREMEETLEKLRLHCDELEQQKQNSEKRAFETYLKYQSVSHELAATSETARALEKSRKEEDKDVD